MATLYFHIPFCKRICTYCDFYKVGAIELIPRVVDVMHRELDERTSYLQNRSISSIYFGGGTPSLLHPEQIESLITHARRLFDCSKVDEITLEANPDDLSAEYIAQLRKTSINRISLGIQSFDDRVLQFMNRRHSASEARECVERLRKAGYDNISIDIIFGVASFGDEWLHETISEAIKIDAEHISAYHLTVEERTRLGVMVRKGEYQPVSEEQSESDYHLVESMLCKAGYEHYEVSNYAKPGHRAKHNSAYWRGVEYLGIGAGAHSFSGNDRRWCISTAKEYSEGDIRFESEELTTTDHLNEYIMTALRTMEGIDLSHIETTYGKNECERILKQAKAWQERGVLTIANNRLFIPTSEFMVSDAVIESLFL